MNVPRRSCRGAFAAVALLAAFASGGALAQSAAPDNAAAPAPVASTPSNTAVPAAATVPVSAAVAARAPTAPVAGGSASGMISGLIFLLALVLGAGWLVKRSGGMPALRGAGPIKIVAAQSLGPRERVVLVEVGGQQWLLGVGGGAVNMLHHFEQPIVAAGNDDFAGKLRQFLPQAVGK